MPLDNYNGVSSTISATNEKISRHKESTDYFLRKRYLPFVEMQIFWNIDSIFEFQVLFVSLPDRSEYIVESD